MALVAHQGQQKGMSAILSIAAAIGSFAATFTGHPFWGLLLALIAVPLGGFGMLRAASPRVSGGILSITAIVLAVIGLAVAVLGMVFGIFV